MKTLIKHAKLIEDQGIREANILIEGSVIKAIDTDEIACDHARVIEAQGLYACPGFIELHAHGGSGHDFMDCTPEAFNAISDLHLNHGVTTLTPTTSTSSFESIKKVISTLSKVKQARRDVQNLPSVHIEGQYIAMERHGGMDKSNITAIDKRQYEDLIEFSQGLISRWSIACELEGALEFGDYCRSKGIIASIAHTDATYDEVKLAAEHGFSHITHLYSDMNSITRPNGFRTMGAIEAAYDLPQLWVEVISDGCHIPPSLMNFIYRHIGPQRLHIVSDCIRPSGQSGPVVEVGEPNRQLKGLLEDGVVKFLDRSAFHGSIKQGDELVKAALKADIPLYDCVRMFTQNPAKILGIGDRKGFIKPLWDADIVLLNQDIETQMVFYKGNLVINKANNSIKET